MFRIGTMSVAVAVGAFLATACDPRLRESAQEEGVDRSESTHEEVNTLGPDVVIQEDAEDVTLWANISANDDSGVSIQGIKEGDSITIENIAGISWFSDQSGLEKFLSTVHTLSAYVSAAGPAGSLIKSIAEQTDALTSQGEGEAPPGDGGLPRDGYGRDMNGNFAREEGGIIVCMPSAHGPMYANEKNHLDGDMEDVGRLKRFVKPHMQKKCFFPVRIGDGMMQEYAREPGVVYILAFDSKYGDNAGSYEVKLRITR